MASVPALTASTGGVASGVAGGFANSPNKIMMAHVAAEVVVLVGITYYFNKQIMILTARIDSLEKKCESQAEDLVKAKSQTQSGGISAEQFSAYQESTGSHINNMYTMIKQLNENLDAVRNSTTPMMDPRKAAQRQAPPPPARAGAARATAPIQYYQQAQPRPQLVQKSQPSGSQIEVVEEESEMSDADLDRDLQSELEELGLTVENSDSAESSIKTDIDDKELIPLEINSKRLSAKRTSKK